MKKLLAVTLICVSLSGAFWVLAGLAEAKVVAANYSDRYHEPGCKIAQKIKPEYLVIFNSPEEAVQAGFEPCKKCHPGLGSNNFGSKKSQAQEE